MYYGGILDIFGNKKFCTITAVVIVLIGIFFRVFSFYQNNCLCGDEANLVIPLIQHTYKNILFSYDELGELAPPFFMFAVKIITNILGLNEYTVRIIPLVSSIFSMSFYYIFVDKLLNKNYSKLFALLLFALSSPLILKSGFFKPYATEVAISMVVLYLFCYKFDFKGKSLPACIGVSLLCLLCFLSSYQSVFIIFSCLVIHFIHNCLFEKDKSAFKNITTVTALNLVYMGIYYKFFLYQMRHQDHLNYLWATDYSFFPVSWRDYRQIVDALFVGGSYFELASKSAVIVTLAILLVGFIALCAETFYDRSSKKVLNFLVITVPCTSFIVAGILKIYPFANRLVICLLPLLLVVFVKGLDFDGVKTGKLSKIFFYFLFVCYCCFTNPTMRNYYFFTYQPITERDIYQKIQKEYDPNKLLYIEIDKFLTSFIYNYIDKFSNNIFSFYYIYDNLSTYPGNDYIINRIKKENDFYAIMHTNDFIDEETKDIRAYILEHYDCSLEMETEDHIGLNKCSRKISQNN